MAHIAPLPARGSGLYVRFVYWMARRRLGRVPTPLGVMAHHPAVLTAAGGFELGFERAHAADETLKHLCMLRVASLVGCRFCIDIGAALARSRGISEERLRALPTYAESPLFSDLERRALTYADQMTETPSHPDAALFRSLERELGVPAVVELTAAIAWENFRARFNHGVGAVEDGFSEGAACLLPAALGTTAA